MIKLSDEIWQSFHRFKPVLVADAGLLLGFWALIIDGSEWKIQVKWIAFVTVAVFTVVSLTVIILWDLLLQARRHQPQMWPRTIGTYESGPGYVFILQPCELYFENALVSIFYEEVVGVNRIEHLIGWGFVSHIQGGDRAIQITPLSSKPGTQTIWQQIETKNQKTASNVICKLSVKLEDART